MVKLLFTALATPFVADEIDKDSYKNLLRLQLNGDVDGVVALGATAENTLLNLSEKQVVVTLAKETLVGKKTYVGVCASGVKEAIFQAKWAQDLGADGLMICPPPFCKCTQNGLVKYLKEVICAVKLPVMLYNAPTRVGYALSFDVVKALKDNVRYVKDAGYDKSFTQKASKQTSLLCGNDNDLENALQLGAKGVVSVVSNACPNLTRRALQAKNLPLFKLIANAVTQQVNPVAIKYLLFKLGVFARFDVRLPLTKASKKTQIVIDEIVDAYGEMLQ